MAQARLLAVLVLPALCMLVAAGEESVTIQVDRAVPDGVSQLALGITHTQHAIDFSGAAHPDALRRAKGLLQAACVYQNQHIMGWGAENPEPSPGEFRWGTLDQRLELIRSMGAVPVITLCAAPDWMKGGTPGKTDWSKIEVAPRPEHYDDFAALARKVAQRYPDVKHYQVWNEFKGFWSAKLKNWDAEQYTALYNKVYDALKSVNAEIKVGGLYLVIEGTGSRKGGWAGEPPVTARQWDVVDYWLKHKRGADFICVDRSIKDFHDPTRYSDAELMRLTGSFGDVARQIRARTDLPLWWSEYYGAGGKDQPNYVAAQYASIYVQMVRSPAAVALLWNPTAGEIPHHLFGETKKADGAQAAPHYAVFKAIHEHFGPGTKLVKATSSSPDVEVLASATHVLLVNKGAERMAVSVNGDRTALAGYEVRLIAGNASP